MAVKLTVVIPCYNQAEYLSECLDSILNQTHPVQQEVIVVNDGSTDNIGEVFTKWCAKNYQKMQPHIRMVSKENGGLAAARNSGIEEAHTEWILTLDADDKIDTRYFTKVIAAAEERPEISIVSTYTRFFGANEVDFWSAKYLDLNHIKYSNNMPCCTLFKRSLWEQIGGYKSNMIYGYEDWEFWINCAKLEAKSIIIPEKLFFYRIKAGSMITNAKKWDAYLRSLLVTNNKDVYNAEEQRLAEMFIQMHDAVVVEKDKEKYTRLRQATKGINVPKFWGDVEKWKKYLILLDEKMDAIEASKSI